MTSTQYSSISPANILSLSPFFPYSLDALDPGILDYLAAVYNDSRDLNALLEALDGFLPGCVESLSQVQKAQMQEVLDKLPVGAQQQDNPIVAQEEAKAKDDLKSTRTESITAIPDLISSQRDKADESQAELTAQVSAALDILRGLRPDLSDEVLAFTLINLTKGNMDEAAERLLEGDSVKLLFQDYEASKKKDLEADRKTRAQVLAKFDERPVTGAFNPKASKKTEKESGIRYLNSKIVSTKGEKYIVENTTPDWDGGSRGRIKTKGKRGPGYVSG